MRWLSLLLGLALAGGTTDALALVAGGGASENCVPDRAIVPAPEIRSFPSGSLTLKAQVFLPCGDGPFPVVIYAHGAEDDPTFLFNAIGPALARRGLIVFGPHRRGAGLSADQGPQLFATLEAIEARDGIDARARAAVAALEGPHLDDIAAAIVAAQAVPGADPDRMYLIGNGFGGVLAMLAAERGLGLKAVANFAGAAASWTRQPALRERLLQAARGSRIPVYLAQAANDHSTEPTLRLAEALKAAGKPHRARIWPAYGSTADHGHGFGIYGSDRWAREVLGFFSPERQPQVTAK